jgi:hypothetical protein
MSNKPQTIAVDFDGVIHAYSKGWQDGTCYDKPVLEALESISLLMESGYSVFILSTRNPRQIKIWLKMWAYKSDYEINGMGGDPTDFSFPICGFTVEVIPLWKKFWNKKNVLGITRRKLAAHAYVDDRAILFKGDWRMTVQDIITFKTYQQ